jgi:transposase
LVQYRFNRIKHFRRVSTRYDKLADSYLVLHRLPAHLAPSQM